MAKDPAFLFYYQDFLVGTEFMSNEEVGAYIRILCHLADKGKLSEKHMLSICRGYAFTDSLLAKFIRDENGNYYNQRLLLETEKRRKYAESRRNNASKCLAYAEHMEDENENINEDINNKKIEKHHFETIWISYPNRQGKKHAARHFDATVKTLEDYTNICNALINYLDSANVKKGFIKNGSTWFNEWQDWINPTDVMMKGSADSAQSPTKIITNARKYYCSDCKREIPKTFEGICPECLEKRKKNE